jgi:predicted DNA-binding mobile mystery protein A
MERAQIAALRRRQIDRMLRDVQNLDRLAVPQRGWIAAVRSIVGMRAAQLAARLGLSTSAIAHFERAEAEGAITLNSLEKVAAALDCRFVYAFVPKTSFEELVQARAELIARELVGGVNHTMALEDQALAREQQQELVNDLAGQLARTLPRSLWEDGR